MSSGFGPFKSVWSGKWGDFFLSFFFQVLTLSFLPHFLCLVAYLLKTPLDGEKKPFPFLPP